MRALAPERIETERLVIRRPVDGDAEAIFARCASDPAVTTYLAWPRPRRWTTHVPSSQSVQGGASGPSDRTGGNRDEGMLIGGTGMAFETPERAATGYVFARDAWGRGYARSTPRDGGARTVGRPAAAPRDVSSPAPRFDTRPREVRLRAGGRAEAMRRIRTWPRAGSRRRVLSYVF
jgi:hypothetical protein